MSLGIAQAVATISEAALHRALVGCTVVGGPVSPAARVMAHAMPQELNVHRMLKVPLGFDQSRVAEAPPSAGDDRRSGPSYGPVRPGRTHSFTRSSSTIPTTPLVAGFPIGSRRDRHGTTGVTEGAAR